MIAHAGEDTEKGQHLVITGSHVNLYSHYGNQWGRFSGTNLGIIYLKIQLEKKLMLSGKTSEQNNNIKKSPQILDVFSSM